MLNSHIKTIHQLELNIMKPVLLLILVTITFLSFTTPAQAKGKALLATPNPTNTLP
ncbi:MAG: hypothetical protein ACWA5R_02365 [bacterium]